MKRFGSVFLLLFCVAAAGIVVFMFFANKSYDLSLTSSDGIVTLKYEGICSEEPDYWSACHYAYFYTKDDIDFFEDYVKKSEIYVRDVKVLVEDEECEGVLLCKDGHCFFALKYWLVDLSLDFYGLEHEFAFMSPTINIHDIAANKTTFLKWKKLLDFHSYEDLKEYYKLAGEGRCRFDDENRIIYVDACITYREEQAWFKEAIKICTVEDGIQIAIQWDKLPEEEQPK